MNSLKLVTEDITGDITIAENSQYNNIQAEKVVLSHNVTARLYGTVVDIVLFEGSVLNLHGAITGTVQNFGGKMTVFPT